MYLFVCMIVCVCVCVGCHFCHGTLWLLYPLAALGSLISLITPQLCPGPLFIIRQQGGKTGRNQ